MQSIYENEIILTCLFGTGADNFLAWARSPSTTVTSCPEGEEVSKCTSACQQMCPNNCGILQCAAVRKQYFYHQKEINGTIIWKIWFATFCNINNFQICSEGCICSGANHVRDPRRNHKCVSSDQCLPPEENPTYVTFSIIIDLIHK